MKTNFLTIIAIVSVSVVGFFTLTTPSTFDFLMSCPEGYWAENLFCYPDNVMVETAASDWIGRFMMIRDPVIFEMYTP
jgi:hypothetical protein